MNITVATRKFEAWMRRHLPQPPGADEKAIDFKHQVMASGAFPFLRATFYQWAEHWLREAGGLADAPRVLAVGDLHIENFGTWRDSQQRLIWGVNDFDEAWELPWTSDLVRLGVSASLAIKGNSFHLTTKEACEVILDGYKEGLKAGKIEAFDLSDAHVRLRKMVESAFKPPEKFWAAFDDPNSKWQPVVEPPPECREALDAALPHGATIDGYRVQQGPYDNRKPTGVGSLGRPRYCVLARDKGERLVREAKALLPSAVAWAAEVEAPKIKIDDLFKRARPFPDPWLTLHGSWIVRRISPNSVKVTIEKLQREGFEPEDESRLFESMGRETANIHLASAKPAELLDDFRARRSSDQDWFLTAVRTWRAKVQEDWEAFRSEQRD